MDLKSLLFGEIEYDENGNAIGRKFGYKNIIYWIIIIYFGNILFSSKRKQIGGGGDPGSSFWEKILKFIKWFNRNFNPLWAIWWGYNWDPEDSNQQEIPLSLQILTFATMLPLALALTLFLIFGFVYLLVMFNPFSWILWISE